MVELSPPYPVYVGPGVLERLGDGLPDGSRSALLADERALELHGSRLGALGDAPRMSLPRGEAAKTFAVLERALEFLAGSGLDRHATVVVLGGGAACDLGGLASSLYMRGIATIYCPTTLLAQVDACVGGKTAVNLRSGKNLAGTFHQPSAVYADTATLATLDEAEFRSGLGEVVKTALIAGRALFERLEDSSDALLAGDPETLAALVVSCVRVKARFVVDDERERGPRKVLNLGHTFAHAIEQVAGHGRVPHGVAVAVGIALALDTGRALGLLRDEALPGRVTRLLGRLGLPASLAELRGASGCALPADELAAAMRLDKKSRAAEPRLVLPRAIGALELDVQPDAGLLIERLR